MHSVLANMTDRRHLLMTLGAAGLAACSSAPPPAPVRRQVMWPAPPELPRYLYEGSLRNAGSVRDESSGAQLFRSVL